MSSCDNSLPPRVARPTCWEILHLSKSSEMFFFLDFKNAIFLNVLLLCDLNQLIHPAHELEFIFTYLNLFFTTENMTYCSIIWTIIHITLETSFSLNFWRVNILKINLLNPEVQVNVFIPSVRKWLYFFCFPRRYLFVLQLKQDVLSGK